MAALGCGDGRIHTGYAAADDQNLPAGLGLGCVSPTELPLTPGVDGAVPQLGDGTGIGIGGQRIEARAAQAGRNGVLQTHEGLVHKLGIGKLLTAQGNKVALAGSQGLLDLLRGVEAADGNHGNMHVLLVFT